MDRTAMESTTRVATGMAAATMAATPSKGRACAQQREDRGERKRPIP
jgi:hypothetical protein